MRRRGARCEEATAKSPRGELSLLSSMSAAALLYCVGLGLVVPPTPLRIDKPVYNRASGSWTLELPPGSPRIAATKLSDDGAQPFPPLPNGDALIVRQLELHRTDDAQLRPGQWRLGLGFKVLEARPSCWLWLPSPCAAVAAAEMVAEGMRCSSHRSPIGLSSAPTR